MAGLYGLYGCMAGLYGIVTYGCESWTIKKAEHQRIDAFELWCWRRLLRIPWTARSSNQSILKEISSEYSLEGLMPKLKLQYFWSIPDVKNWLIGKDPDAGKDRRQEEKGTTEDEIVGWHHWLNGHESDVSSDGQESYDGQGSLACCSLWRCKELDTTEWLNWTDIPVGLSHCSSGIVCNLIITKLIMGYTESSVERGNLDKCCNSPCEKQHYLELWVVALYRDQIEMNLNCIL